MDFIVAFPAEFRQTIATLVRLDLASRDEVVVDGSNIRLRAVTSTVTDNSPKPKASELDVDMQLASSSGNDAVTRARCGTRR